MSILDTLKDVALGAVGDKLGSSSALGGYVKIAETLLSNKGGVGGLIGLVSMFDKAQLGNIISSWIGKTTNLPISGEQIQQVLGSNLVGSLAKQAGIGEGDLVGGLTKFLPDLVDQLTPDGKIPQGDISQNLDITKLIGSLLK